MTTGKKDLENIPACSSSLGSRQFSQAIPTVSSGQHLRRFERLFWDDLSVINSAPAFLSRAERTMLFATVLSRRPSLYLEIGTAEGGSAAIVASAMNTEGGDGRLFCVDPAPNISPELWELLQARTTLFKGSSPSVLSEVATCAGAAFDLVFIDGSHHYGDVLADAQGVLPFLADGGLILFHDGFNTSVNAAIERFLELNVGVVFDAGFLTRDIFVEEIPPDYREVWGGLRSVWKGIAG